MKQIPEIRKGYKRKWTRCRTCGNVAYEDYQPYSLGNPVRVSPCGHGVTQRDLGRDSISADEAMIALNQD